MIRERLQADHSWQHFTQDGRWICPYCLTAVRSSQPGKQGMLSSIERHLSKRCNRFENGQGVYQAPEAIVQRQQYENIVTWAMNDPAWQVFDHEGFWYSPSSLKRVPRVRIHNRRFDGFTIQRMAEHMAQCEHFQRGVLHDVATVQQARDHGIRVRKLADNIIALLGHPIWRYTDALGCWICPYCLDHIPYVRITGEQQWPQVAEGMAEHLLAACKSFSPEQQVLQPEERVREASEASPPSQLPDVTQPAGDEDQPSGSTSMPPPTTPAPQPASPDAPIATPISPPRTELSPAPPEPSPAAPAGAQTPADPPAEAVAQNEQEAGEDANLPDMQSPPDGLDPELEQHPIGEGLEEDLGWMEQLGEFDTDEGSGAQDRREITDLIKARDVQQNMLREAPEIEGFTFATRYESCSEVSGDFYEFIPLSDGRIGFAQGDVSGHGMQAGLIMSMAKKVLSIYARMGSPPREVLSAVNDALVDDLGGRMFVTCTYAILDPDARTMTWARAGHNPSLHINHQDDSAKVRELTPGGMVVGMKKGPLFGKSLEEEVTELASGDIILLYTDGVTETMNRQNEEYGPERLNELLETHATGDLDRLLDRIMDSVRSFRGGGDAQDDVTLLALAVE